MNNSFVKSFLLFIGMIGSTTSLAQLKIVMDTKPVGSALRVSKYNGDMTIALDSVRYRGEQEVVFEYDNRYTDGIYLLEISTIESFQFVLVGQENLTAHLYESGAGMAFKPDQSKENDAFNIMMNLSDVYSSSMDTLNSATAMLSDFAPRHTAISDSLTQVYHRIAKAYNNSLGLLENLFPETYAAQVLVPLDKIPLRTDNESWALKYDNDPAFNHVHYFDYIDFSDPRIASNPFLTNKVLDYLFNYTERSEQGVKSSIDKLLNLPKMHPKVQSFVIDLLVDFFTEKNAAEFLDHINRNYLGNCELPLSESTLAKMESMVKFKKGDAVPILKMENQAGRKVPLTALTGDLNVLVFWTSWCPHCVRELPKLQALHSEMQGKLGVYAVSLDTNKIEWINTINEQQLKWLNVNDFKGWETEALSSFNITSTPTLVLLDDKLNWIGRASSFDGMADLVKMQLDE